MAAVFIFDFTPILEGLSVILTQKRKDAKIRTSSFFAPLRRCVSHSRRNQA
jgi:hypothetical protein